MASVDAARRPDFERFGIADAVLLELASETSPLVTVDGKLYYAAYTKQSGAAFNFRHWSPQNRV